MAWAKEISIRLPSARTTARAMADTCHDEGEGKLLPEPGLFPRPPSCSPKADRRAGHEKQRALGRSIVVLDAGKLVVPVDSDVEIGYYLLNRVELARHHQKTDKVKSGISMSKHKSTNKDKGGQLVIHVNKYDRAAFIAERDGTHTSAAREIRRFMREFVASKTPQSAVAAEIIAADITNISAEGPAAGEPCRKASNTAWQVRAGKADTLDKLKKGRLSVKSQ